VRIHADDDVFHSRSPRSDRVGSGEEGSATSSWAVPLEPLRATVTGGTHAMSEPHNSRWAADVRATPPVNLGPSLAGLRSYHQ